MIELRNVTDRPHIFGDHKLLFEGASLSLPKGRYALLSETPELHPAVIDVLAGLRPPRYGYVEHVGLASWPVGRMGFVRGKLTGIQMSNFICSLYGLDRHYCLDFLNGILSNPEYLSKKILDWPAYVRQEYTFSLSLVPAFELYFIDNVMPADKSRFSRLWHSLFEERIVGRSLVLSSYSADQLMDYCTKALIYEQGSLRIDDDLDSCLRRYPLKQSRADRSTDAEGDDSAEFEEAAAGDGLFF
jgi:capsular polysaccharide transport system ATP-binding protein